MAKMKRLSKLEGFANVQMIEDDIPVPKPDEVLIRVVRSLISSGSEIFRRYVLEDAIPKGMGYSDAGEVVEVGSDVKGIEPGQRAMAATRHAQYVVASAVGEGGGALVLPDGMSYENGAFLNLATSALQWARTTPIEPDDTVVVLGQGVVGLLYMQLVRLRQPGRIVTVDMHDLRCKVSKELGADVVINGSDTDSLEAIRDLTDGQGAEVVVDCVGGKAGADSFEQTLEMTKVNGVAHLIGRFQGGPPPGYGVVPLQSSLIQRKMLVGAIRTPGTRLNHLKDVADMVMDGRLQVEPMITQRLPWQQLPDAYHLLYRKPHESLGVILEWDV